MEMDARYLITWDVDLAVENDSADRLCAMFESVWLSCANCLRAADLKSKVYHDRTTQLLEVEFAEGDLVYWKQCCQGKLLFKVEGPYTFRRYANVVCSSAVVFNESMKHEVSVHSSLLVRT